MEELLSERAGIFSRLGTPWHQCGRPPLEELPELDEDEEDPVEPELPELELLDELLELPPE